MFVTDCGSKISLEDVKIVDANEKGFVLVLANGDVVQIEVCNGASEK